MVDAATVLIVTALLALQGLILTFVVRRLRGPSASSRKSKGAEARPRLVLMADARIEGTVEVEGDLTLRASARTDLAPTVEIDVPTEHVDLLVDAFRRAGFGVRDSGTTVDTDEGEETLTTVVLELDTLERPAGAGLGPPTLSVRGDVRIERGARVRFGIASTGKIVLEDETEVRGDVRATGRIEAGSEVRVDGELTSQTEVKLGPGSRARSIVCSGDVHLADAAPELAKRVRARRVLMGSS